jgi:hypothetical protein
MKSRALFDPRQRMVAWPEPNDDPNIPYAWGLSGYSPLGDSQSTSTATAPAVKVADAKDPAGVNWRQVGAVAGGIALTLGVKGFVDGYSETPSNAESSERLKNGLITGLIYATGVGFVAKHIPKG